MVSPASTGTLAIAPAPGTLAIAPAPGTLPIAATPAPAEDDISPARSNAGHLAPLQADVARAFLVKEARARFSKWRCDLASKLKDEVSKRAEFTNNSREDVLKEWRSDFALHRHCFRAILESTKRGITVRDRVTTRKLDRTKHEVVEFPIGVARFIAYSLERERQGKDPSRISAQDRARFLADCAIGPGNISAGNVVHIYLKEVEGIENETLGRLPRLIDDGEPNEA